MKTNYFLLLIIFISSCSSTETIQQEIPEVNNEVYFPPLNSNQWETTTVSELGWNQNQLQPLYNYLEEKNSKSFMILHKGRIVVEQYFNGHNEISPWYWASAGKTLTTAITGIAEAEGLLNIDTKVSDYIGMNWTSLPLEKENLITCKNLLSMTSGLDDSLGDNIEASNLQYVADAGQRWAYHNVYVKLQDVVSNASNQSWDNYFNTKLKNKIGMTGAWLQINDFNVYWSTSRSMARFGLLISANGKWEDEQIIPESYLFDATNTSQNLNQSYGYMWWLNGKQSYRLPQTQFQFSGNLIPNAPEDMYCALGRDDQKIYVIPSKNLVIIRMGEAAEDENFALSNFDNMLWEKINNVID